MGLVGDYLFRVGSDAETLNPKLRPNRKRDHDSPEFLGQRLVVMEPPVGAPMHTGQDLAQGRERILVGSISGISESDNPIRYPVRRQRFPILLLLPFDRLVPDIHFGFSNRTIGVRSLHDLRPVVPLLCPEHDSAIRITQQKNRVQREKVGAWT